MSQLLRFPGSVRRDPAIEVWMDEIAFGDAAVRLPLAESIALAREFIAANPRWIIEGCYGDIIEPLLSGCEQLILLNPGVETCTAHCRSRPWEPDKYATREAQDKNLEYLIQWVRQYDTRQDEYGLVWHRKLFEAFQGFKYEFNDPSRYAGV
jgi:hypothetical protein